MVGRVTAKRLEKSVTVIVERQSIHPLYKKAFIRSKKYLVDDPIGVSEGDVVEIIKVAPQSKRKQFRVTKILGKQMVEITEEKLKQQAKGVIEEVMPASPDGGQGRPEEKESEPSEEKKEKVEKSEKKTKKEKK